MDFEVPTVNDVIIPDMGAFHLEMRRYLGSFYLAIYLLLLIYRELQAIDVWMRGDV